MPVIFEKIQQFLHEISASKHTIIGHFTAKILILLYGTVKIIVGYYPKEKLGRFLLYIVPTILDIQNDP